MSAKKTMAAYQMKGKAIRKTSRGSPARCVTITAGLLQCECVGVEEHSSFPSRARVPPAEAMGSAGGVEDEHTSGALAYFETAWRRPCEPRGSRVPSDVSVTNGDTGAEWLPMALGELRNRAIAAQECRHGCKVHVRGPTRGSRELRLS
ncbi:hypothetical protein OH77DRAFT_1100673 [Trametes cingulata]|nr:hypothetical protein OH77DRAFT_1100673 [Trametes cingulata]